MLADRLARRQGCLRFSSTPSAWTSCRALARISGCAGMERESFFHALNQKCAARKAAQQLGKPYEDLRLIVAHLAAASPSQPMTMAA